MCTIVFPKNGRFELQICPQHEDRAFYYFSFFLFEVSGCDKQKPIPPANYIPSCRDFIQLKSDVVEIFPSDSYVVTINPLIRIQIKVSKGAVVKIYITHYYLKYNLAKTN